MARSGKSYISTAPKEPRENKAQKLKRLEEYRQAKAQTKKFVIPGIIAVCLCLLVLFTTMYGFKGTRRRDEMDDAILKASEKYSGLDTEASRAALTEFMKSLVEDEKDGAEPEKKFQEIDL
ncbi:hypothetical protein BGX27_010509 [Mortierella sp. AM989]|nr:hypothetical protein BGX27_010509 [Mortierella sp. AM989]